MYRKAFVLFPSLNGRDAASKIGGYLLPRIEPAVIDMRGRGVGGITVRRLAHG